MKKKLINYNVPIDNIVKFIQKNDLVLDIDGNELILPLDELTEEVTKNIPIPSVTIKNDAFIEMMYLVQSENREIAWHGLVNHIESVNTYVITEILMYPQIAKTSTVDADEDRYTQWIIDNQEVLNHMRMQGHSHVNMPVFPSGVDDKYYRDMIENQVEDYYIFLIVNKSWDIYVRFYDVKNNIVYDQLPISIHTRDDITSFKEWDKIKKECIKEEPKKKCIKQLQI